MSKFRSLLFFLFLLPSFLFATQPKEKLAVIVNPLSGGKKKEALIKKVSKELSHRYEVETLYTKHSGHATELAREALKRKAKIVVAVGGDARSMKSARL